MRISILGSCVTRDAFPTKDDPDFQLGTYLARSSLGSALAPPPQIEPPYENIASDFQRRMVQADVRKGALEQALAEDFDAFVYDPIDERFALAIWPDGSVATVSNEFAAMKWELPPGVRKVAGMSDEHFELWQAGWRKLLALVDAAGKRDKLFVHRSWWADSVRDSPGESPVYGADFIAKANAGIKRMMDVMEADLPAEQFIDVERGLFQAYREHQWGLSPFHYIPEYYDAFRAQLQEKVR